MKRLLSLALLGFVGLQAQAGVIVNNSVAGAVVNNFNALPSGNVAGTISQVGATYGERFGGQTLGASGGFDTLSGTPSGPLSLQANATVSDNVGVLSFGASGQVLYGDLGGVIGEGALSILLTQGSDVIGFDIVGSNQGSFLAQFFRADGSLIGSITQAIAADGFFGFQATGGDTIFGVSLTNDDPAGIGYDNVTFNQLRNNVPEPTGLALVGLGLGLAGALRRRSTAA